MSGSLFGRHGRLGRVALVSCLLTGATAVGAGPAMAVGTLDIGTAPAQPSVRMTTFDPADFTDPAADLPSGLVEAVERDLEMSPEEYLASAAAARRAGQVVASLGETARSAWLVGQTLHVAVADRADAQAVRATGAEVQVGDALADALAAARAQNKVAYIDRTAERVVPVDADVEGEPVSRLRLFAQSADQPGGSGFAISDLLSDYYCSTGFNGVDADGHPRVLTAGHCGMGDEGLLTSEVKDLAPPAPLVANPTGAWPDFIGTEIGEYVPDSFVFGGGRDAGLIDITDHDADAPAAVAPWSADEDTEPLPVYDSIDAIAGAAACSSGVTSGWSCGRLLDAQTTVPVSGQDVTGFVFDACVLAGDSGGAVVVGNYALGINSGSTWRGPTCGDGSATDGGADISLGYAISSGTENAEALYADQWELLIHVGAPVVTSPAEGSTVGTTPTLTGTVDAAAGATVTVSIDDGPTLEAEVGPAGRWRAAVDETLEPGTYEYEVTVSHGTETGSTTTTSEPVTGSFEVAEVAGLGVSWPQAGHVGDADRPTFEGTGEPGATVTLTVDEEERATATVGEDGTWSLTPDDGLGAGRFDAVLTQQVDGTSSSVTVSDMGVAPSAPVITSPRAGDEVGTEHTFTGVGLVGATVSLRLSTTGDDRGLSPAASSSLSAQTDEEGTWEIELDGPLPAGRQVVVATQSVGDLTSEPSRSVTFEVTRSKARAGGDLGGGDTEEDAADLAETGASSDALLLAGAVLLAGGAAAAATTWRRRRLPS